MQNNYFKNNLVSQDDVNIINEMILNNKLEGNYKLLGEGLSGKVYDLNDFVVKTFKEDASESHDSFILKNLQDTNAFPELYSSIDNRFMIIEKVNGHTLAEYIKAGEKIPENVMEQLEDAFLYSLDKNLIPADMHLNNIMIDANGKVKIIDVGRFIYSDQITTEELVELELGLFSGIKKIKKILTSSPYKRRHYHSYSSSDRHYRRRKHYSSSSRRYGRRKFFSS